MTQEPKNPSTAVLSTLKRSVNTTQPLNNYLHSDASFDASHLDIELKTIDSPSNQGSTQVFNCQVDHSGTLVYVKAWRPKTSSHQRSLLIVHDLGEDHTFFDGIALNLSLMSIPVFCMDLRGHGRSGGLLGHVDSFQTFVVDILQVAARIRHQSSGEAPYVMGCGTLALAVMDLEAQFPGYCAGTILLSPTLKLKKPFPRWRRFLISQLMYAKPHLRLSRFLKPKLVDLKIKAIDRNQDSLQIKDKTNRMLVSASLIHEVLRAIDWSGSRVLRLSKPCLLIYSKRDRIVDRKTSQEIISRHKKPEIFDVESVDSKWHNPTRDDAGEAAISTFIIDWYKKVFTN